MVCALPVAPHLETVAQTLCPLSALFLASVSLCQRPPQFLSLMTVWAFAFSRVHGIRQVGHY